MDPVAESILQVVVANAPINCQLDLQAIARRITRGLVLMVIEESAALNIANNLQDQAFKNIYAAYYMKLISNLNPEISNSRYLLDKIYAGEIEPTQVAKLSSADMNPAAGEKIREELTLRLQQKVELKFSTAYRCSKCEARQATYSESQNRAADEQSTLNLRCLKCGHTWRR